MADDKQVNESAFLKALNKKNAAAKVAAKAKRPSGILNDQEILDKLGIDSPGQSINVPGRVSKVQFGYAKNDTNRPYFRFAYSLSSNSPLSEKGKGLIISTYHELTEAEKDGEVWRTEEQAFEQLFFEFQGLGEDTESWSNPVKKALERAKYHTSEKTEIDIRISSYLKGNGTLGMNISAQAVATDDSDLEDDEEEEGEEEELDNSDFVGSWVTWEDDEGAVDFLVESYDEESETFSGKDEDGDEFNDAPVAECELAEDQRED